MSEWISVFDMLPCERGECIIFRNGNVETGYFNGFWPDKVTPMWGYFDGSHHFPVTHWMPLPDPPKE